MKPCTVRMLVVAALVLLEGCGGNDNPISPSGVVPNTNFVASESFTFNLDGAGRRRISLAGINGGIVVNGGPAGSGVSLTGEREVRSNSLEDARAQLSQLQVEVQDVGAEIFVRTRQPQNSEGRNYVVNYRLQLPASIELDIANLNGSLDVIGMVGGVSASLLNGRTEANVGVPAGGQVSLTTTNGEIVLHLPLSTSAAFSAQVVNGTITLTDLVLQNEVRTARSLQGTLGAGNGTVTLRTTNGAIRVDGAS